MLKNDLSWLEVEVLVSKLPLSGEKNQMFTSFVIFLQSDQIRTTDYGFFSAKGNSLVSFSYIVIYTHTHTHRYTHFS